jgi:hypothetical protein
METHFVHSDKKRMVIPEQNDSSIAWEAVLRIRDILVRIRIRIRGSDIRIHPDPDPTPDPVLDPAIRQ